MSKPLNQPPSSDGDVNYYEVLRPKDTRYWDSNRRVIFINGMDNSVDEHRESALALSEIQMCRVTGVYNKTEGFGKDVLQCLEDKLQWDSHGWDKRLSTVKTMLLKMVGSPYKAEEEIKAALSRNKAAVSLYDEIRANKNRLEIFAHSQGNLILSNVLTGLSILFGKEELNRLTVHSFGSPTVNWPEGFKHYDHGFTFDYVNWLSGFDSSFSISKVGLPTKPEHLKIFSHGFLSYIEDDAAFVVNHFRWGSFVTFSMDEEGLAERLAGMRTNMPRVRSIFQHLYHSHNSDVDDVALLYINKIKNEPKLLACVRSDLKLKQLLIKSFKEGYTSSDEEKAIEILSTARLPVHRQTQK